MVYLLIVSLVLMIYAAYILNGKDILSPWLISIAVFLFSISIMSFNMKDWEVSLSLETCFVIIAGLLSFGLGEILSRCSVNYIFKCSNKVNKTLYMENEKEIIIPNFQTILILIFMTVVVLLYFRETYRTSLLGGNPGGYSLMLKYARTVRLDVTKTGYENHLLAYARILTSVFAYFFAFVFMYNNLLFKFHKKNYIYLFPTFIYLAQVILTSGRVDFIYMITAYLVMWILILKKKYAWSTKKDIKIIKIGIVSLGLFLICFYLLGTFTGKNKVYNLGETISIYIGSPIAALNQFLASPGTTPAVFGEETLLNVYSVLRKLGLTAFNQSRNLEYISIGEHATNIYTVFRRYIYDYSIIGMFIIQFLLGFMYSSIQLYIKYHKKINIVLIIFAIYFYPITMQSIDELFLSSVLSLATIYKIIITGLIYWFFVLRKTRFCFRLNENSVNNDNLIGENTNE